MKPAQFLSDLHLAPGTPALARAFVDWAHGPAHDASAVYVLGDLFDAWIGDEQVDEPFFRPLVAALRSLADAGVPVAIVRGNRDFLLGERFARAAGATLLPERSTIDAGGVRTLILHGDSDTIVPPSQGFEFFRALKDRGVPTELVIYPREPHGLRERAHNLDRLRRYMAWFKRYV